MGDKSLMAFGAVLLVAGLAAGDRLGQERVERAEGQAAKMQAALEKAHEHDAALRALQQSVGALGTRYQRLQAQQQDLVGALQSMADCVVPGAWMDMGVVPVPDVMRAGDLTGEPVRD